MKRFRGALPIIALFLLLPALSCAQESDGAVMLIPQSLLIESDEGEQLEAPVEVVLEELGTSTSWVRYKDSIQQVPTSELVTDVEAPQDKRIAYIYAPKSGKVTLRASADKKGEEIGKCTAGTVVRVLEYGESLTKIDCYGDIGYVLTSCLQFQQPEEKAKTVARLCCDGDISGGTTVNIRNATNKSSVKVGEWKTGTSVTILSRVDGWYEVEAFGVCGYVMQEYVQVGEAETE